MYARNSSGFMLSMSSSVTECILKVLFGLDCGCTDDRRDDATLIFCDDGGDRYECFDAWLRERGINDAFDAFFGDETVVDTVDLIDFVWL
mmetsp:Transcript_8685/g.12836  ORF Transcript_8685/g.12836 Transcript_8685/m.12836 type:complete len:90 (-) Transcript_8685:343-612(-)